MSLENITFTSGGEDYAAQVGNAMAGPFLPLLTARRAGGIVKGHTEEADDGKSYAEMLRKVEAYYLNPMRERTHGNASVAELQGAIRAAVSLADICWAFVDKATRQIAAMEAAAAIEAQQEE